MSIEIMSAKVKELRELKRMQEELAAEIEAIQDEIKGVMTAQEVDTLTGADWKVTWKAVTSSRFDSKAFKADHADLYGQFSKTTVSRRFCVA